MRQLSFIFLFFISCNNVANRDVEIGSLYKCLLDNEQNRVSVADSIVLINADTFLVKNYPNIVAVKFSVPQDSIIVVSSKALLHHYLPGDNRIGSSRIQKSLPICYYSSPMFLRKDNHEAFVFSFVKDSIGDDLTAITRLRRNGENKWEIVETTGL